MRADDLDTAANEQRDEEKVKEVGQSDPQRESELERVVHNAKLPACDSVKLNASVVIYRTCWLWRMAFVNSTCLAENILLSRRDKPRSSIDGSAKAVVASLCRGCPHRAIEHRGFN